MFARLTFFNVLPKDVDDLKKVYHDEVVPVIKKQRGNMGAWLLEPSNEIDDYISLTEWVTKADADAYESSGTYKALVDKVKHRFNGNPVLKTYSALDSKIMMTA
jgi:heme-degrading monooxygenase HmoA